MDFVKDSQISVDTYTKKVKKNKVNWIIIILLALLFTAFIISSTIGRYFIPPDMLIKALLSKLVGIQQNIPENVQTVLFNVRLPRIFAAIIVGSALSMSGATYQGMFKNPMVSPDILGASAGAGFGAALGILMSFNSFGVQISAFIFGILAVSMSYFISNIIGRGNNAVLVLVLTGMVVSTLFQSFISITKYVADPYSKLPAITFWLMGGLSSINMKDTEMLLIPILIGGIPLMLFRWKLNVLSFGEEEAKSMGINTARLRLMVILCSTLMTAAAVSISGMIGWVGLIIPHLTRMIVGPNYKILLPASLLVGSTYLLLVDDIARSVFSLEIPLGILTSMIGAPFFIYLLLKGRKGWI